MTPDKLKSLFKFYDRYLERQNVEIEQHKNAFMRISNLEHVRYMCNKAPEFVDEGRIETAMRWLGFVQGVLFVEASFSIEELKEHSKERYK